MKKRDRFQLRNLALTVSGKFEMVLYIYNWEVVNSPNLNLMFCMHSSPASQKNQLVCDCLNQQFEWRVHDTLLGSQSHNLSCPFKIWFQQGIHDFLQKKQGIIQ